MSKIKKTESYKTVMRKAFWKKVLNNIIIFGIIYLITLFFLMIAIKF